MYKPSTKTWEKLKVYIEEYSLGKYGAMIRTANRLGVSKQYVEILVRKYNDYITPKLPMDVGKTFTCKVCKNSLSKKFKKSGFKQLCIYCYEKQIFICSRCGANFLGDYNSETYNTHVCRSCSVKLIGQYHKRVRKEGGEKHEILKKQQRGSAANFRKKYPNYYKIKCGCGRSKKRCTKYCDFCVGENKK